MLRRARNMNLNLPTEREDNLYITYEIREILYVCT